MRTRQGTRQYREPVLGQLERAGLEALATVVAARVQSSN